MKEIKEEKESEMKEKDEEIESLRTRLGADEVTVDGRDE